MNKTGIFYELYNFENENRYIVISNNCYYNVDLISFKILDGLKNEQSFGTIANAINLEFGINYYSENNIKKNCFNELKEIIINVNKSIPKPYINTSFFCRINLMKPANT